jgi:hypothetical protein
MAGRLILLIILMDNYTVGAGASTHRAILSFEK